MYDLIIKGGEVLDPGQGLSGALDIAVARGRIVRIAERIDPGEARRVVDVKGRLVTPGLIDLHTHVYCGMGGAVSGVAVPPDLAGVSSGVTTVVDAGSAGSHSLGGFANYTVPAARTRVLAFLNICRAGLWIIPEAENRQSIDLEATIRAVYMNSPLIRGVKIRMVSPGINVLGLELAQLAIQAARETRTCVMVHIGDIYDPGSVTAAPLTRKVLGLLAPGDIIAHVYTGKPGGILDDSGRVVPELLEAMGMGVLLDCAFGLSNFSFDAARRLLDQGVMPHVASSDLTLQSRSDVAYSLTECMSKLLTLGFGLHEVIRMTTAGPAQALGMSDTLGAIAVGREADISVLEVVEGEWEFTDVFAQKAKGDKALAPVLAIRAGQVIAPGWGPHPWGWLPPPGGCTTYRPRP